jgi:hypothetical protein
MLKHNDWHTSHDYREETLSIHALEGCYAMDWAMIDNQLSATNTRRCTCTVQQLRLETIQDELIVPPVSQQVYHLRETHVGGVCRSVKLTSLKNTSQHFEIPNSGQQFRT